MKKLYESPTTELVELEVQNIILGSNYEDTTQNKSTDKGSVELPMDSWD